MVLHVHMCVSHISTESLDLVQVAKYFDTNEDRFTLFGKFYNNNLIQCNCI